jgi:hypothetical protein
MRRDAVALAIMTRNRISARARAAARQASGMLAGMLGFLLRHWILMTKIFVVATGRGAASAQTIASPVLMIDL